MGHLQKPAPPSPKQGGRREFRFSLCRPVNRLVGDCLHSFSDSILVCVFLGQTTIQEMNAHLLAALIAVESSGNDRAIGDHGKAFGCLQIHQAVVEDVNRVYGTHYRHADVFQRKTAIVVADRYLSIYATRNRLGHDPTNEDFARIWNCGPSGWKGSVTDGYWNKVKGKMK